MCIIHYLLGIGDRHLDNIMLKLSSGQFLGIDFGHAFGSATVSLAVPEMVPFRLTPQLQNLMSPYGVNGEEHSCRIVSFFNFCTGLYLYWIDLFSCRYF